LRVEDREETGEVASARRCDEGVDHSLSQLRIGLGWLATDANPTPGPAGELPRGVGRSPDDGRDLVERQVEDVVQNERHPLGRTQGIEEHEQRGPDGVGEHEIVFGSAVSGSKLSSRRVRRERRRSRHTRATTVVSHPPRLATLRGSAWLTRSQAS
jgi:hypothetical protein